ncbi:MAG: hypothetical protein HY843_06735 [Bdellovibrio sp.]|nr:hypothetical protein [Bdellovibrio sp.]
MKTNLLILCALVFSFHFAAESSTRINEIQIDGIYYDKDFDFALFPNGKVQYGLITREAIIQNTVFHQHTFIVFYLSSLLKYSEISASTLINGVLFTPGSQIQYYGENVSDITIYKNKLAIQYVLSYSDYLISDIPCRAAEKYGNMYINGIYFYESGRLESCYLSRDVIFAGNQNIFFAKDYWLRFYDTHLRKVRAGTLAGIQNIQGIYCDGRPTLPKNYLSIQFHPEGALQWCFIAQDTTIEGKSYKKGQILEFDVQGKFVRVHNSIWDFYSINSPPQSFFKNVTHGQILISSKPSSLLCL